MLEIVILKYTKKKARKKPVSNRRISCMQLYFCGFAWHGKSWLEKILNEKQHNHARKCSGCSRFKIRFSSVHTSFSHHICKACLGCSVYSSLLYSFFTLCCLPVCWTVHEWRSYGHDVNAFICEQTEVTKKWTQKDYLHLTILLL